MILPPRQNMEQAPDGSSVEKLARTEKGSMATFTLPPNGISRAVAHKTVEELWYVLQGAGEMWQSERGSERIIALRPGIALVVPCGAHFQFRALGKSPLKILGVTMPPWPDAGEACFVPGHWR